jgi:AcrR family transcriptional regulator
MAKASQQPDTLSRSAQRRLREKEQRCNTVLKAAEKLFSAKGYHQAGMEEIADMAEISTGAVYFYFKNKEDILIRLMHDIGFFLREWLGKQVEKNELTVEGFCNIGDAFMRDFCVSNPEKITIFFRESVGQSPAVEKERRNLVVRLTSDIKDVLNRVSKNLGRKFVSKGAADTMALCVVGIFERVAYLYVMWPERKANIDSTMDESVAFVRGGVNALLKP